MKNFEKQILLVLFLSISILIISLMIQLNSFSAGSFFGINTPVWMILSITQTITHQTYVLIGWRTQLHYSFITKRLGEKGLPLFVTGFFILFGLRVVSVVMLAIQDYHMEPVTAAEIAKEAQVKKLVIVHVTPALPNENVEKIYIKGVSDIYSGEVILGKDRMKFKLAPK